MPLAIDDPLVMVDAWGQVPGRFPHSIGSSLDTNKSELSGYIFFWKSGTILENEDCRENLDQSQDHCGKSVLVEARFNWVLRIVQRTSKCIP